MATVEPYDTAKGKRYRVRYRKPDGSQTMKRGFTTKRDATEYLARVEVAKTDGVYVDPTAGRITVGELSERWLDGKRILKPSAYYPLPAAYRVHVAPTWAERPINTVQTSEVQVWLADLSARRSATVTLRALGVLAGILDMAVTDGRLKKNPARGIMNRPKKPKRKTGRSYLTHTQLELLALSSSRPTIVRVLGLTGLRWGEVVALRVRDVDLARRRLHAEQNAPTVGSHVVPGTLKGGRDRWAPYPAFLGAELAAQCAGAPPERLLFPGPEGGFLRRPDTRSGWFVLAVQRAQQADEMFPRVTPHDLRHTAASLAVRAGANVLALQRMLGHESAAMTLDRYADLFDDDLDAIGVRLDAAHRTECGQNVIKNVN